MYIIYSIKSIFIFQRFYKFLAINPPIALIHIPYFIFKTTFQKLVNWTMSLVELRCKNKKENSTEEKVVWLFPRYEPQGPKHHALLH